MYRRALAIDEKALGPDHPDTARDFNNLAWAAAGQRRPGQARSPCIDGRWRLTKGVSAPHHPSAAIELNNLAGLLEAKVT